MAKVNLDNRTKPDKRLLAGSNLAATPLNLHGLANESADDSLEAYVAEVGV